MVINRVLRRPSSRPPCRLLPTPICQLHPIRHIRRSHLLPRSVLPNNVADPVTLPLSAAYVLRMRSRLLQSHTGFRPSRTACVPPSARFPPRPKHLGVHPLSVPRLPPVVSTHVSLLSSEYTLALRSLCDHITRPSFLPCLRCSLVVERTSILTSMSVYPASASFAALITALSRPTPSWPAWHCTSSGMPRFLFMVRSPLSSTLRSHVADRQSL